MERSFSLFAFMAPSRCIVNGCNSVRGKSDANATNHAHFYAMPFDDERRKVWLSVIENCNGLRPVRKQCNLKNATVCEKHFSEDSFHPTVLAGAKKLLPNAVPSIFFGSMEVAAKEPTIPSDEADLSDQPPRKKQRINYVITNQLASSATNGGF